MFSCGYVVVIDEARNRETPVKMIWIRGLGISSAVSFTSFIRLFPEKFILIFWWNIPPSEENDQESIMKDIEIGVQTFDIIQR